MARDRGRPPSGLSPRRREGRLSVADGEPAFAARPLPSFRRKLLVEGGEGVAFAEDAWIGKVLRLGSGPDAPAVAVTMHDKRCVMINLDPDTATAEARMLKAAVRLHDNNVGVYAVVVRPG